MVARRVERLVAVLLLAPVLACCTSQSATQVSGDGLLFGQMDCLGIKFDSGSQFPISYWPDGYSFRRSPGATPNGVLLDPTGQVVLKEGDEIHARVSVIQATGDTRCFDTDVATVLDFRALSGQTAAP